MRFMLCLAPSIAVWAIAWLIDEHTTVDFHPAYNHGLGWIGGFITGIALERNEKG